MTAYQIAIQFETRNSKDVASLGVVIGGKNSGVDHSLSKYIARELSARIKNGEIVDIEGGFISNDNLIELRFKHNGKRIESSLTGTEKDLSIFRLIGTT